MVVGSLKVYIISQKQQLIVVKLEPSVCTFFADLFLGL